MPQGWNREKGLRNLKLGPTEPLNKLLPVERESVLQMATKEEYADLSHRVLTATFPGTIGSTIIPVSIMSHRNNITRNSKRAFSIAGTKILKNNINSERR